MKLQQTPGFGLKILILSLLTAIFFYIRDMETNSSDLSNNENDFTPNLYSAEYIKLEAMHFPKTLPDQRSQGKDTGIAEGQDLMNASDCYTCHAEYKILLAPSFSEIAARYKNDKAAMQKLASKVISGSLGTWGDKSMPGHPELLHEDAQKMIQYIMNLNKKKDSTKLRLNDN
ncbi:MAG: c-type cytochrome [Flavitalea sp.]